MRNMKLILSVIQFLKEEAKKENADTRESLEVAVQCLQTAYDIGDKDSDLLALTCPSLEEIFLKAVPTSEAEEETNSEHSGNRAEAMKNLGNDLMKSNRFHEAVKYYTAAIELDSQNAIYYGNRAAAYSKLNEFQNAIKDCEKAIELDPKYAKAYGRMGLAYASVEQHDQAINAFKKAVEIDPSNESYRSNLKIALEKKEKPSNTPISGLAGLSCVDWHTLFSNPAFRSMASTLMQDPNIISALSAGMSSSLNQVTSNTNSASAPPSNESSGANPNASPGNNRSLEMLIEAGQYLAAQMQAANPDLVEQFRQTTSRNFNPPNQDNKDSTQ
ncbi:Small glutamine-rich tetratricopeptide repeat-containing protein alpha, partial [Stegodyphus mimosarum]